MTELDRVRTYLQEKAPELTIIEFATDTSTSFLAAQALGTEVGRIAKSIVFKTKKEII